MTDYVLRRAHGDIVGCSRCNSEVPTVEHEPGPPYDERHPRGSKEYLCVFCYETHIGTILRYDHHRDDHNIARALAQALNVLMREVKKP